MDAKEYRGNILRLRYPSFLRVESEEPEWSAFASKNRAAVVIRVNPEPADAESFARLIRNPHFPRELIRREGRFVSANGIEGHERIADHTVNVAWDIDGKFRNRYILNIGMWASTGDWHDGTIWGDMVNSIDIVGDPAAAGSARRQ